MRVFIGGISSDERLAEVLTAQQSIIPVELRSSELFASLRPTFFFGFFNPEKDARSLEDYLSYNARSADAVFILVDSDKLPRLEKVKSAPFICFFEPIPRDVQFKNALSRIANRSIQNFFWMLKRMNELDNEQPLKLPTRNFLAEELRAIVEICAAESAAADFARRVDANLAKLKRRKQPRRDTDRRERYYFDDDEKLFSHGREVHARLATGTPHSAACILNGNFRFGKRIDPDRHFNVTKVVKGHCKIGGIFPNCHDSEQHVKETTHLNMFANDFF